LVFLVEFDGGRTVFADDGLGDFTSFNDMNHVDMPGILVFVMDKLDALDKHRVVSDGAFFFDDGDSFHISFSLAEFALVVQELAQTEQVVLQVVTLDVEADLPVVVNQSTGEHKSSVADSETVENLDEEFFVVHFYKCLKVFH
jgi:hypothetical protein